MSSQSIVCPHCGHRKRPRGAKRKKVRLSDLGPPGAKFCSNMLGGAEKLYLANTGKSEVPAHDPAFGRLS